MESTSHDLFAELFVHNQTSLYRYIVTFVPNRADADELFQVTNLTLWKTWDRYDPQRPFLAWAYAIAQNHIRNFFRKQQQRKWLFSDSFLEELSDIQLEEDEFLVRRQEALNLCLEKLAPKQRELLEWRYQGEQSMSEVARRRGLSLEAAYKAIQRIRASLFECINRATEMEAGS
jgi:RNA polymerase sigma-70 factor (ECF subfamily)